MLLFEGDFGTILHSGDCRLDDRYLDRLPTHAQRPGAIDLLYLDCSFGDVPQVNPMMRIIIFYCHTPHSNVSPRMYTYKSVHSMHSRNESVL